MKSISLLALVSLCSAALPVAGAPVVVRGGSVTLTATDGTFTVTSGRAAVKANLWRIQLQSGRMLQSAGARSTVERIGRNDVRLRFESPDALVRVRARGTAAGVDLTTEVSRIKETALEVSAPAALRFSTSGLKRVLFPSFLGVALKAPFFAPHTEPSSWSPVKPVGPEGLRRVAGITIKSDTSSGTSPVTVTDPGKLTLGTGLAARWAAHRVTANRLPEQTPQIELLHAGGGAFLGGHRVENGWLYRFGGLVSEEDSPLVIDTLERLAVALAENSTVRPLAGGARRALVLISVRRGPVTGSWSAVNIASLQSRLAASSALAGAGVKLRVAQSIVQVRAALTDPTVMAVVNPYGEWFASDRADGLSILDALHTYLARGGTVLNTGGYSFYVPMIADMRASLTENYPSRGFSDYTRIETAGGALDCYGVQDAHDSTHIFVPARWEAGSDDLGGHVERIWRTFVAGGQVWSTPATRFTAAPEAGTALRAYALANGLDHPLSAKMSPVLLAKWKRAIHIKSNTPSAADDMLLVARAPAESTIHIAHYMRGGFDHQIPDLLPPNPNYGTAEEFRAVIDAAHARGDLFMPYTNHTWWNDNPKGPTYAGQGNEALLLDLDGQPKHERYGPDSSGWSVSPYHPATIAAADRIQAQFTTEYPSDILFQDQNGARGLEYDTNPASPVPYAYNQGWINTATRASSKMPVATEDGFDHLLNAESEFCGLGQNLPIVGDHPEMHLSNRLRDPDWEFFPIAQYVAHDKAFFMLHDLEVGVTDHTRLAWALALGYQLSTAINHNQLSDPKWLDWVAELDRVQKALGPFFMGAPLRSFRYLRGSGEHGVMEAVYGEMRVVANVSGAPYQDGATTIPADSFHAVAPGVNMLF